MNCLSHLNQTDIITMNMFSFFGTLSEMSEIHPLAILIGKHVHLLIHAIIE